MGLERFQGFQKFKRFEMFDVRGSRLGSFAVGEVDSLQFTLFRLPGSPFRAGNVIRAIKMRTRPVFIMNR